MAKRNSAKLGVDPASFGGFLVRLPFLLVATAVGRTLVLGAVLVVVAFYLPARFEGALAWTWSLFVLGGALAVVLLAVAIRPAVVVRFRFWRFSVGGLLCALAVVSSLALVNGTALGIPFSMAWSDWVAFVPFDFSRADLGFSGFVATAGRAFALVFVGSLFIRPVETLIVSRFVWRTLVAFWHTLQGVWQWCGRTLQRGVAWHKERAAVARAARMQTAAADAAYIHNSELEYEPTIATAPNPHTEPPQNDGETPNFSNIKAQYVADFPWLLPTPEKLTAGAAVSVADDEIERKSAAVVALFADLEQKVEVANVVTGARFSTYEIRSRKNILNSPELQLAVRNLPFGADLFTRADVVAGILIENDDFAPAQVTLRDILRNGVSAPNEKKLPLAVGTEAHSNRPIVNDLVTLNSVLIVGDSQAERTHFLNSVLASVLLSCTPNAARLLIFGPPDGIASRYAKLPHLFAPPATDDKALIAVLDSLVAEMQRRLSARGDGEFVPALNEPRIFIAFEELDACLPLLAPTHIAKLARLAKWGHRTGIQLIATASTAAQSKIPLTLNAELHSRVCFKVVSAENSRDAIDVDNATRLLGAGDMLYVPQNQVKPARVQCATISDADLNTIINHWENAFAPKLPKLIHNTEYANSTIANSFPLAKRTNSEGAGAIHTTPLAEVATSAPKPAQIHYEPSSASNANRVVPPAFTTVPPAPEHISDEDGDGRFAELLETPRPTPEPNTSFPESEYDEVFNNLRPNIENLPSTPPSANLPTENATNASPPSLAGGLPANELLTPAPVADFDEHATAQVSERIKQSMAQHGVAVEVDQIFHGPAVTMYGLTPGWKVSANGRKERVKVSQILNLEKDLALALGTPNIRFEPVVPGETVIGVEVPNAVTTQVNMRSVTDTPKWAEFERTAAIPLALGLGNGGVPIFIDLAKMPHLLIAGATGSGKSVCINALITSALMFRTPEQVRMVLIDPKRVELRQYADVPHLYTPIVVETDQAIATLRALVQEMDSRFDQMSQLGVRSIDDFNRKSGARMPYLFVVIDELADLMMTSANEVERTLARLAQLGRASGIHLAVATQRPSVDVVTGLIKSNFASRISFTVTSNADSRTILDRGGGEKLLGRGDMLMLTSDQLKPARVQGVFLSDGEIDQVAAHWRGRFSAEELPQLDVEAVMEQTERTLAGGRGRSNGTTAESYFEQAVELAQNRKTLSITHLQTRLGIGFPKATRLMDELEEHGIVGPHEQGKPRQVILNLANTV